jgi:hypothetical protein
VLAAGLLLLIAPAVVQPATAQTSAASSGGVSLLSRFDFAVGIEHIASDDPRFVWDAYWSAELDPIDYGAGRVTLTGTYQTILGEQFRMFDPTQGNYTLAASASARAGMVEVAGVLHHVSRHLSDRPKTFAVDWNMLAVRALASGTAGRTTMRGRVDLRKVMQRTYVDYEWELDAESAARVGISPRVGLVALGAFRIVGVDGSRGRGTQHGFRAEAGVQFDGSAAVLALFVAGERRIDPYQLEFGTATWATGGFRLSSH